MGDLDWRKEPSASAWEPAVSGSPNIPAGSTGRVAATRVSNHLGELVAGCIRVVTAGPRHEEEITPIQRDDRITT